MTKDDQNRLRREGYVIDEGTYTSTPFPVQQFLSAIWNKRRVVLLACLVGFCMSLTLGLAEKKKYTANVLLMPPDASSLSTTSTLAILSGNPLAAGLGGGGGLLSSRTAGGTVIGILGSRTVQDNIVNQFHLMTYFNSRYQQDARARLAASTDMVEDKKSGILSIDVTTKQPALARDIANAYIIQLDAALNTINTSSARRERVFLEERLRTLRVEIDDLADQLSKFSSKTGTLNPQAQGAALFESVSKIETELGAAQADLSGLRATYSDDNVRVRAARARIASLSAQLTALGGSASSAVSGVDGNAILPTIRQLPHLGMTYVNLSQRLLAEQAVYATLTRQYELARVEEAKEIPSAKVLATADLPQKPSSATAAYIAIVGTLLCSLLSIGAVCLWALFIYAPSSMPLKAAFTLASNAVRT